VLAVQPTKDAGCCTVLHVLVLPAACIEVSCGLAWRASTFRPVDGRVVGGLQRLKASGLEIESSHVNQGLQLPTPVEGSVAHAHDCVFYRLCPDV
jgi:hypothetical protein